MRRLLQFLGFACLVGGVGWALMGAAPAATASRSGTLTVREAFALRAEKLLMLGVDDRPVARAVAALAPLPVTALHALQEAFTAWTAPDTYAAWAAQHFTAEELADPQVSDPDAIYGIDGMPNILKYALGLDPKRDGTAALPQTDEIEGHWFHTFHAAAEPTDIEWCVEASTDLERWTAEGVTLEPISLEGGKVVWQAQYQPADDAPVVFRLWPRLVR
jgi:hypothetical protein